MAEPVEIAPENERELVIARRLKAPAAKLFRCWTDPELIPQWFCPKPWVAKPEKMDVRPGGGSRIVMYGPNGEAFPNDGVYLEVVPNKRLVFTDAFTEGWKPTGRPFFVGDVSFEEQGNGETLYVARARHWTVEGAEEHKKMGFHEGWGIVAEQLEALAQTL